MQWWRGIVSKECGEAMYLGRVDPKQKMLTGPNIPGLVQGMQGVGNQNRLREEIVQRSA